MKKLLILLLLFSSLTFTTYSCESSVTGPSYGGQSTTSTSDSNCVWVNGYTRSNGTYVSGHWRSKPGKTCNK
jgi:hypothetical protein